MRKLKEEEEDSLFFHSHETHLMGAVKVRTKATGIKMLCYLIE